MALIKRDKRIPPGWEIKLGPSKSKRGHYFSVKKGETIWTCHTCGQKFTFMSLADHHECENDPDAVPWDIKRLKNNGFEVIEKKSKLVKRKNE